MKKIILNILAISLIGCTSSVQEKQEVTLSVNDAEGRKLMIVPMGQDENATEMAVEGNTFHTSLTTSQTGFYNIISIKDMAQSIIPFYIPRTEAQATAQMNFGKQGTVSVSGSDDNQALAAYLTDYVAHSRALWNSSADLQNPAILTTFITKADSILQVYDCSNEVEAYLKIWSYINAYDNYTSVQHILRVKSNEMPYKREDILPAPHTVLDNPLAALFSNTPQIVFASLPNQHNLDSALIYLNTHYNDTTLKQKVKDNIAGRYVSRFNYTNDSFDQGLERLQKATEEYNLDPRHLEEFARHKATISGQPFPENVVLKDADGNVVDFSTFRGKYVYIDMWASWCTPCLREVPALQKLEKELKNDKVTFLSVSIDTKEEAWKKKMEEKNMHGHQLWNPDNSLGQALNVKGIPFFVIYDPEGKLYMHGAPRPSQGPGVKLMLEELK